MSKQPDPRIVADLYQAYQHGKVDGVPVDFRRRLGELFTDSGNDQGVIQAGHAAIRLATGEVPCSYGSPDTRKQPDDYCTGCTMPLD